MLKEKARMIARVVYVADLALTTAAFFAAFFLRDLVLPRIAPDQFPTGLFPLREYVKIYPVVLILWSVLLFSYHSYHSHRTVPLLRAPLPSLPVVFRGTAILAALACLLPLRQQVGECCRDGVADEDDANGRQRLAQERDGAVAVIAVITEEKDGPENQDDGIDLDVFAKGEEPCRELVGRNPRQHEVTEEEGGKERSRRERKVGNIDDPGDHARLFFKHSTSRPVKRLSKTICFECTTEIDGQASTAGFFS